MRGHSDHPRKGATLPSDRGAIKFTKHDLNRLRNAIASKEAPKRVKSNSVRWKEIKKLVRKNHAIRERKGPAMTAEKLDKQRRRIDKKMSIDKKCK